MRLDLFEESESIRTFCGLYPCIFFIDNFENVPAKVQELDERYFSSCLDCRQPDNLNV